MTPPPPKRLTRKERQEQTRTDLLDAATRLLPQRGLLGTSVEQIAAEAGYTKGAFYANFASKEALLLAMLDRRFDDRIAAFDRILGQDGDVGELAREGGADFAAYLAGDRRWEQLFFEFAAHAGRDEAFGRALRERYDHLIDRLATAVAARARAAGIEKTDAEVRTFALMVFVAANGVALQGLVDPDGTPDDLLPAMLELLTRGAL